MRTFSPRLALKALWQLRVRRRPYVLSHAINSRCNLKCSFCEYWKKPGREMSTPEIFSMLEDAKSFGIGAYNAWTTEPLLRDDLPEILKKAKSLGLMTSLVTNGRLLVKRIPELSDLDYLTVSIDGIKSYRELRGMDLDQVLKGVRAAKSQGHEILINCVIGGKNLGELEDMVGLARDLGVWISFEPMCESGGIDKETWDKIGIRDMTRYKTALDRLIELKSSGAPIINSLTYLKMIRSLKPQFRCHASDIIIHVSADGTVENCRVEKAQLGDVSEGFLNIWKASNERRRSAKENCKGCLFFGYVENSLLYEFVPEVMAHYEWM